MARADFSTEGRRAQVFGRAGAKVFFLALLLSLGAYAVAVWRDGGLFSLGALAGLALFPLLIALLIRPYLRLTTAPRVGFQERVVRLLLRLLLWLGSLWHLLAFAYLALELALGSGLVLPLIH